MENTRVISPVIHSQRGGGRGSRGCQSRGLEVGVGGCVLGKMVESLLLVGAPVPPVLCVMVVCRLARQVGWGYHWALGGHFSGPSPTLWILMGGGM